MKPDYSKEDNRKVRGSSLKKINFTVDVDSQLAFDLCNHVKYNGYKLRKGDLGKSKTQPIHVKPIHLISTAISDIFKYRGIYVRNIRVNPDPDSKADAGITRYEVSVDTELFIQSVYRSYCHGDASEYETFKYMMVEKSFLEHLLDIDKLEASHSRVKTMVYEYIERMYYSTFVDILGDKPNTLENLSEKLMYMDANSVFRIILANILNIFSVAGLIIHRIDVKTMLVSANVFENPDKRGPVEPLFRIIPALDMLDIIESVFKKDSEGVSNRQTLKLFKYIEKLDKKFTQTRHSITLENLNKTASKHIKVDKEHNRSIIWRYGVFSYNMSRCNLYNSGRLDEHNILEIISSPDNYTTYFKPGPYDADKSEVTINIFIDAYKILKKSDAGIEVSHSFNMSIDEPKTFGEIQECVLNQFYDLADVTDNVGLSGGYDMNIMIEYFIKRIFEDKMDIILDNNKIAQLFSIAYLSNLYKRLELPLMNSMSRSASNYIKDFIAKYPELGIISSDLSFKTMKDLIDFVKKKMLGTYVKSKYIEEVVYIMTDIIACSSSGVLSNPNDSKSFNYVKRSVLKYIFNIEPSELTYNQNKAIIDALKSQSQHTIINSYACGIPLSTIQRFGIDNPIISAKVLSEILNMSFYIDSSSENFILNPTQSI